MRRRKSRRARHIAVLLVLAAVIALLLYDSARVLSVSEYEISSAKLPASFDGFKIVQLSDLHGAFFGDNDEEIAEMVRAESPDMIALTGDLISDEDDLGAVRTLLSALSGISDIYFVSGNHDYGSGFESELAEILAEYGVHYLRNEYLSLERGGESIVLAGVEDPNSWADMIKPDELCNALREEHPDSFAVLLGHRNYWPKEYPALPVELILCGHNHGGIVRLPGVGGLLGTDRTLLPDYDKGLFSSGTYSMIVSAGLGNSVPIPRFLNRPEIVSVTLHSTAR